VLRDSCNSPSVVVVSYTTRKQPYPIFNAEKQLVWQSLIVVVVWGSCRQLLQ